MAEVSLAAVCLCEQVETCPVVHLGVSFFSFFVWPPKKGWFPGVPLAPTKRVGCSNSQVVRSGDLIHYFPIHEQGHAGSLWPWLSTPFWDPILG